jgi:hypothetical protein
MCKERCFNNYDSGNCKTCSKKVCVCKSNNKKEITRGYVHIKKNSRDNCNDNCNYSNGYHHNNYGSNNYGCCKKDYGCGNDYWKYKNYGCGNDYWKYNNSCNDNCGYDNCKNDVRISYCKEKIKKNIGEKCLNENSYGKRYNCGCSRCRYGYYY